MENKHLSLPHYQSETKINKSFFSKSSCSQSQPEQSSNGVQWQSKSFSSPKTRSKSKAHKSSCSIDLMVKKLILRHLPTRISDKTIYMAKELLIPRCINVYFPRELGQIASRELCSLYTPLIFGFNLSGGSVKRQMEFGAQTSLL